MRIHNFDAQDGLLSISLPHCGNHFLYVRLEYLEYVIKQI